MDRGGQRQYELLAKILLSQLATGPTPTTPPKPRATTGAATSSTSSPLRAGRPPPRPPSG
jgi:hypothetical protein